MIRYRARWVLPISARPVEDGVVAVENDRIAFVGAAASAPRGDERDLGNAALLPGLVNAHTHLELTALREGGFAGLDFPRWIARLQAIKKAVFDRERFLDSARIGIVDGLSAGITTYADTCDSGVAFDAMLEAGVRGIMYQEVFGPDPSVAAASLADLVGKIDAMRPRETALVKVGVSPHAPFTVSDDLYRRVADYSQKHSLPVAVHIAESAEEKNFVERGEGPFADNHRKRGIPVARRARSSIDLLATTGVLTRRPLLIHCVRVDADDIGLIARGRCPAAHCPISNRTLGHGTAPLAALLDAGVRIGLGSDSMASNPRMDLLAEARAAAIDAPNALRLATLGGAEALGLDRDVGSLEAGKQADLAAFSLDGADGAVRDPVDALFQLVDPRASLVTVAGRELVRDGRVAADADLAARVNDTRRRIRAWAADEMAPSGASG